MHRVSPKRITTNRDSKQRNPCVFFCRSDFGANQPVGFWRELTAGRLRDFDGASEDECHRLSKSMPPILEVGVLSEVKTSCLLVGVLGSEASRERCFEKLVRLHNRPSCLMICHWKVGQ